MNEFVSSPLSATQVAEDPIDPGFTVPDTEITVPPSDDVIDPDFSVIPPVNPVYPVVPPYRPTPVVPCIFCNNNQWIRGGIRLLNAATGYTPVSIYIDNRLVYTGLSFSEITQYQQISQGYHTFTVMSANGYVYVRKSMYVGDGMATVAVVNSSTGLNLVTIADTACPTSRTSACFRIRNLAYYSGLINATLGNVFFNAIGFNQDVSFSQFEAGSYTLNVSRSARPETPLVTSLITLNPSRIYTAYVLNWNQSADTMQTLLVEDRRN